MEPLEPIKFRIAKTEVDIKAERRRRRRRARPRHRRGRGRRKPPGRRRRAEPARAAVARDDRADPQDDRQPRPGEGEPVGVHRPGRGRDQPGAVRRGRQGHRLHARRATSAGRPSCSRRAHQDETVAKPEFVVPVSKSVTDKIVCDSKVEVAFARVPGGSATTCRCSSSCRTGSRSPRRWATTTPTGRSSARRPTGDYLYLVRETKGTDEHREPPVGVRGLEDQVRRGALPRAEGRLLLPQRPEGPHRGLARFRNARRGVTVSYETAKTVEHVLKQIHARNYLMPAIQREFVWGTSQIAKLVDSLMRGYPWARSCSGRSSRRPRRRLHVLRVPHPLPRA